MMKNFFSTLTLLTIALTSLGQNRPTKNNLTINKDLVIKIEISNGCAPTDTCLTITHELTGSMKSGLIDKLNKSNPLDTCNYYYETYWLNIYLADRKNKIFGNDNQFIIDSNNSCFDLNDPDYLNNIWIELNKK